MSCVVSRLKGREIIDSRGCPALEVEVFLENGRRAVASVPSGASTGRREARELRDGDQKYFFGKGVKQAVQNVHRISDALKGIPVTRQKQIDDTLLKLDGTPLKSRLGANTLLAVSLACLRASAKDMPLYTRLREWYEGAEGSNKGQGSELPQRAMEGPERGQGSEFPKNRSLQAIEDSKGGQSSLRESCKNQPRTGSEDPEREPGSKFSKSFSLRAMEDPEQGPGPVDQKLFLPVPLMNVINGGVHAENPLSIQEFMIVPFGFDTFRSALRAGCEIFQQLKADLQSRQLSTNVGDEGGFAPCLSRHRDVLDLLMSSIEKQGYGGRVGLALDCAADGFYKEGVYHFEGKKRSAEEMTALYEGWIQNYPLLSIEDGLSEEDGNGWRILTEKLGGKTQIVGDDLFVTQTALLKRGIESGWANALLVKCNQVGTVSETLEAVREAKGAGYACVMSHRSGETEDTFIADLSVGWDIPQIKTGSVCRGERTAKYNRLLRIEEELGDSGVFRGKGAFS